MHSIKTIEPDLTRIPFPQQAAVCCSAAQYVLPFFCNKWTESRGKLSSAVNLCWGVAEGNTVSVVEMLTQCEALVPTSEDAPDAGAAIPAGETVLALLYFMDAPSAPAAFSVLLSAYTTVEMAEYLTEYGTETSKVITPADLEERRANIRGTNAFMQFTRSVLTMAKEGREPSFIRERAIHLP